MLNLQHFVGFVIQLLNITLGGKANLSTNLPEYRKMLNANTLNGELKMTQIEPGLHFVV